MNESCGNHRIDFRMWASSNNVTTTSDVTPDAFAAFLRKRPRVAFVGSGLSIGSYKSWADLVADLMAACNVPLNGDIEGATATQLMDYAELAWKADSKTYAQRIHEMFGWKTLKSVRIEYDAVVELPFTSFLTTNFDPCLLYACQRKHPTSGFHSYPTLPISKLRDKAAFYLHGFAGGNSPPRGEDIILAKSAFDAAYCDGTLLHAMLQEVFMFRNVVFIGCSLSEPQLEKIFERCRVQRDAFIAAHPQTMPPDQCILLPAFLPTPGALPAQILREEGEERLKEQKLRAFGVKVLRYSRTLRDEHDALREFLTQAAKINAPATTSPFDEEFKP